MRIYLALILLLAAGCGTSPVEQAPDPALDPPILAALPDFSSQTHLPVTWSGAFEGARYLVQRADDPDFTLGLVASDWIDATTYTFEGLTHGATYHFRVKARLGQGPESDFSTVQTTTLDTVAPQAAVALLNDSQTSLMFWVDGQAADEGSGLAGIRLFFLPPGGIWAEVGLFDNFPVSFQATLPGVHSFKAVAIDLAGNIQDDELATVRTTVVPEPIIITDRTGEDFDITNAVLRYGISEPLWGHGLGRNTIVPIINPDFLSPGDHGYPLPENLVDVMAVDFGGEQRAYPIGELADREVVNDTMPGVHLAATY